MSSVQFDRGHLCYSRPAYISHTDVITAGLPPKRSCDFMLWGVFSRPRADILNILNPSSPKSKSTFRQRRDYHERMEAARHLSKYLFPREYGLATAFASVKAHKYPDFADREDEIKVRVEYVPRYSNLFRCYKESRQVKDA
jgi:Ser-tRNA(Ala) deacylase AlaX